MWRESFVPELLGVRRLASGRTGQWTVVDAQGQRSTINGHWSVNDACSIVKVHF